jgi:hypothetical protein
VHAWERDIEQTLVFNVDMAADVRTPAATDELDDAAGRRARGMVVSTDQNALGGEGCT